jgi:predicted O-methyltransferase YrrM
MPDKFTEMTAALHRYAVEHSDRDELFKELAQETDELGGVAVMMMAPDQGALTTVLVRAIGARRALEIGTFTGYGALSIARGLPDDGYLLALDVSEEWTEIARRYFERAGLAERIELRIAPALETLRGLEASDPFDFCFIDADKESYPAYYEEAL